MIYFTIMSSKPGSGSKRPSAPRTPPIESKSKQRALARMQPDAAHALRQLVPGLAPTRIRARPMSDAIAASLTGPRWLAIVEALYSVATDPGNRNQIRAAELLAQYAQGRPMPDSEDSGGASTAVLGAALASLPPDRLADLANRLAARAATPVDVEAH